MSYERFRCEEDCEIIPNWSIESDDYMDCPTCGSAFSPDELVRCARGHGVCEYCVDDSCFELFKIGLSKAENPDSAIGEIRWVRQ